MAGEKLEPRKVARMKPALHLLGPAFLMLALGVAVAQHAPDEAEPELFQTADNCMACHNGLSTPGGEDISIGFNWRASIMANSARDPYWQAAVRREILDFPTDAAGIENECSTCHMPMSSFEEKANGGTGQVFAYLPIGHSGSRSSALAADGVSCTVCHQITGDNFGQRESFTGGFLIDQNHPWEERRIFGPLETDSGRASVMRSASAFVPTQSSHVQQSELCATCHTLYTHALGAAGAGVELPEQMPYLEWANSDFSQQQSCQACHMPVVSDSTAVTSVLGQPRADVSRHVFIGGNAFMLRMLNKYRAELGVTALPQELEAAAQRTETHLQTTAASLSIQRAQLSNGRLEALVRVENLAGHKLPTGYPSRRVWIEFTVRNAGGNVVFRSGALEPDGSILGNDNDRDPRLFEQHHSRISTPEQVQVYESIMAAPDGTVTTGLLTAVDYLKDNRLLPRGFDKAGAVADVDVHGTASEDDDFVGGADDVLYSIEVPRSPGPFQVEAVLWFQPIGRRWAENLRAYDAPETNRFVAFYDSMAGGSATVLARSLVTVE